MSNNGYQQWPNPYAAYPNQQGQPMAYNRQPVVVIPRSPTNTQQYQYYQGHNADAIRQPYPPQPQYHQPPYQQPMYPPPLPPQHHQQQHRSSSQTTHITQLQGGVQYYQQSMSSVSVSHPQLSPKPRVQPTPNHTQHSARLEQNVNRSIPRVQTLSASPAPASVRKRTPSVTPQNAKADQVAEHPSLPVDYQVLLLALAEEYVAKAHSMSLVVARTCESADVQRYYKLLATGFGCIDSVLKNWSAPDPRKEARLRLQYAGLLFEDTDDEQRIHDILVKGTTLCERSRLFDLKNSMHHLSVRLQAKSNPRAAIKTIDNILPDIEAYQQTAWAYAFRFLRVSISLTILPHADTLAALQQLRIISTMAEKQRHFAILSMSCILECLVHLNNSSHDSLELAQRALATARTHQLDPSLQKAKQLSALLNILDLAAELAAINADQAALKMTDMQRLMDKANQSDAWTSDGSLCVPIGIPAWENLDTDAPGILQKTTDGECAVVFNWLKRSELYGLGYLLSGVASLQKNWVDEKAEKYFREGLKITADEYSADDTSKHSVSVVSDFLDRRATMRRAMQILLVFTYCIRSEWPAARKMLDDATQARPQTTSNATRQILMYLDGVLKQAAGNELAALACYQHPELILPPSTAKLTGPDLDYRMLSALNSIPILRQSESTRAEAEALLDRIEPLCVQHPNRSMIATSNVLRATAGGLQIIKIKAYLQVALKAANNPKNPQLLAITMSLMTSSFFHMIVGDQAEKSARVAVTLSQRAKNPMWTAVANGMLSRTLELCGKNEEAVIVKHTAENIMEGLPEVLKGKLTNIKEKA